jgi:hypothetical protein
MENPPRLRPNIILIKEDPEIWYKRLAYLGQNALKQLPNAIKGCEFSSAKPKELYNIYI